MKEELLRLFEDHASLALVISIALSIIVAILGLVPSVFITAANILFFGFWNGLLISILGEALGAVVSFWLYRKGFKKAMNASLEKHPSLKKLVMAEGKQAFLLVLSLRLIPFVPSGLVTFAAAIGRVAPLTFILASSIGKIPALFLEAWSVQEVTRFNLPGKIILALFAIGILYYVIRKIFQNRK